MATKIDAKAPTTAAALTPPVNTTPPILGDLITVRVAEGAMLINNETGALFNEGEDTPQTVTVTTLRRLQDGDLVRVD